MKIQNHSPRKRFGQNFLINHAIIDSILQIIQAQPDDPFIEIGPGLGALTYPLLHHLKHLTVIELDRDLIPLLQAKADAHRGSWGALQILHQDVLKADWSALLSQCHKTRIIGNLPYNISTPLLFLLFGYASHIQDMHFMLQLEVVERLAASPHSKTYGRLSVIAQALCEVELRLIVPKESFNPIPQVTSAIVKLTPKALLPSLETLKRLEALTHLAFHQRRKQLKNTLGSQIALEKLEQLGINPQDRPENVSVAQYVQLAEISI